MYRLRISILIFYASIAVPIAATCQKSSETSILKNLADMELTEVQRRADAVILLEEVCVEIASNEKAYRDYRIVKKILKSGHPEEGAFTFSENQFLKIEKIDAKALFPDGRLKIIDKEDIHKVPAFSDFVLYSDTYSRLLRIQGVRAGTVVEVTARQRIKNLVYLQPAYFQDNLPIVRKSFTLIYPKNMKINIHAFNMRGEPDETREISGGKIEHIWNRSDIDPIEHEDRMPAMEPYLPVLWFTPGEVQELGEKIDLSSWEGIIGWYEALSKESLKPGSRIKGMVKELEVTGCSDCDAARRIYHYVQENIRYVAVFLGLGGFQPHKAEKTLEYKYGDCKDQSTVLVSALRKAGIESYSVIVRTRDRGRVDGAVPSPAYFNHMIAVAMIDGEAIFMDPTCYICSFGVLPFADQGADALVVREGEKGLVTLPVDQFQENRFAASTGIEIDGTGAAVVSDTVSMQGYFTERYRGALHHREGRTNEEIVKDAFLSNYPFATMKRASVEGEDPRSDTMSIIFDCTIPEFIGSQKMSFVCPVLRPLYVPLPKRTERTYPFSLGGKKTVTQRLSFIVPHEYMMRASIDSLNIQNEYFEYAAYRNGMGAELLFRRQYRLKKGLVSTSDIKEISEDIRAIRKFESSKIVIEERAGN